MIVLVIHPYKMPVYLPVKMYPPASYQLLAINHHHRRSLSSHVYLSGHRAYYYWAIVARYF